MAATVMTVLGPVDAGTLGTTLMHEHCFIDLTPWFVEPEEPLRKRFVNSPVDMSLLSELRRRAFSTTRDNIILDDPDLASAELEYFRLAGGKTVVDVTCYGLGRDVEALRRLSLKTNLHIIASTGFYVENAHPPWVREMDSDELCSLMVSEINDGVANSGIRCGLIGEIGLTGIEKGAGRRKTGPITREEEKVLRAAGRASLATGVSVSVHTDPIEPRSGNDAVDILADEGVAMDRIIIGHMDQVNDLAYHLSVAEKGVFIEYDSLGREHYDDEWGQGFSWGHDSWRVQLVAELINAGHLPQLLLSQDVALKTDLRNFGGNGYGHVLMNIVPTLRAMGIGEADINQMLVENPARALSIAEV